MRTFLLAGGAAFAMIAAPAAISAQVTADGPQASTNSVADKRGAFPMDSQQQSEFDRWPAEQQTMYRDLGTSDQEYYWRLNPQQRDAYRYLDTDQRATLQRLTPEQQTQAWSSIVAQVQAMQNNSGATGQMNNQMANGQMANGQMPNNQMAGGQTANNSMANRQGGNSQMATNAMGGQANAQTNWGDRSVAYTRQEIVQATPRATQPSEYPLCTAQRQDSCINPYAAGRRGPNVTKPLGHWPGRPASSR